MEGRVKKASQGSRYSALFTELNKDYLPWCHGMMFFKEGMTFDNFSATVEERLFPVGRLSSKYDFNKQGFIKIDKLDKDYHIMEITDELTIDEIANKYMGDCVRVKEIDHNKPLWFCYFFSNISDGRTLAVISIAHVVGDGVSLVELVFTSMDEEEVETNEKLRANKKRKMKSIYGPLNKGRIFLQGIGQAVASVASQPDSKTPLRRSDPKKPSITKSMAFTEQISLDKVKEIKNKIEGTTVNDVLVSVLNMIIVAYLKESGLTDKDIASKKIRGGFPINLRKKNEKVLKDDGSPNNKFGIGIFRFFTTYQTRIELVHRVKGRIDRIKLSPYPVVQSKLGGTVNKLQTKKAVANLLLDFISQTTCQLSNVAGPQRTVKFGGVEVDHLQFGLYSVMGVYLGLISYAGKVSCCVCMDSDIGEAKDLAKFFTDEFNALYEEVMALDGDSARPTQWSTRFLKI